MSRVPATAAAPRSRAGEVLAVFLRLGCTSFGGPVAHIGFFRDECVRRRGWLTEAEFADLVALCHFLPGPASSQLGLALGHLRAGLPGAAAAWLGFTLPSAALMLACAAGVRFVDAGAGWLHGLKIAAVAVVAQAVMAMSARLCPDARSRVLALAAAALALGLPTAWMPAALIAAGLLLGTGFFGGGDASAMPPEAPPRRAGGIASAACLAGYFVLLFGLPALAEAGGAWARMAEAFYRSGALVFGGGHVVLPLLESATVPWVSRADFLAGYGAAQALPGPLFAFAAYLGALMAAPGWLAGLVALFFIYLPSFLLMPAALPHWRRLRGLRRMRGALAGAGAVVVGLLLAALVSPVGTSALTDTKSAALALAAFIALQAGRLPPWLLVALCALAGGLVLG